MERSKRIPLSSSSTTTTNTKPITTITKSKTEFDLNLDNYNLSDLLALFKLDSNFSETDLKNAKRVMYQMHPDKSGLAPEFFLFFQKAHKTLEDVLSFTNKRKVTESSVYSSSSSFMKVENGKEKKRSNAEMLNDMVKEREKEMQPSNAIEDLPKLHTKRVPTSSNVKEFNRDFNRAFDETGSTMLNPKNGYNHWLTREETKEEKEKMDMMSDNGKLQYLKEKYRNQQIALYQEPELISGWSSSSSSSSSSSFMNGTMLDDLMDSGTGSTEDSAEQAGGIFNSGMFESVQYQDLKQAYTQSVIPVTEEDFATREKYRSVDDLQRARSIQSLNPMNERDARNVLEERQRFEQESGIKRAFRFAQDMEKGQQRTQQFDRLFMQIKN